MSRLCIFEFVVLGNLLHMKISEIFPHNQTPISQFRFGIIAYAGFVKNRVVVLVIIVFWEVLGSCLSFGDHVSVAIIAYVVYI